jgi:3-hydroxybutyryl-CoA dehydrogenase
MSASDTGLPAAGSRDMAPQAPPRFQRVAVVGGGYMGGGIAQSLAIAGLDCALTDVTAGRAVSAVERLTEEAERYEREGLFPAGAHRAVSEHLVAAASLEKAVAGADYIAEAVPEDRDLKLDVLARIARSARTSAVIASNTSAIPIGDLAGAIEHPERFLGVHWMNPAFFVPCVEVIPTGSTAREVVTDVMNLLRALGKAPTEVNDTPGFIANRLQYALFKECALLLEEGVAEPGQIDEVVRNSFGFRLPFFGPFAIADIAGLDVYLGAYDTMHATYGERMATPSSLHEQVASGRLGLKARAGYYDIDNIEARKIAEYRDHGYSQLITLRRTLAALEPKLKPARSLADDAESDTVASER